MSNLKACCDCLYFRHTNRGVCTNENVTRVPNLVWGGLTENFTWCEDARVNENQCGISAKHYKENKNENNR